jgi:hypothetical protein
MHGDAPGQVHLAGRENSHETGFLPISMGLKTLSMLWNSTSGLRSSQRISSREPMA